MQKLNLFGHAPRIVGVLYGHHGGGKVYNYLADDSVRTGDICTPMVTHAETGKTYKTLGRIVRTESANGNPGQNLIGTLDTKGIELKKLGHTDQRSLPGYYEGWGKVADERYEMRKLSLLGE